MVQSRRHRGGGSSVPACGLRSFFLGLVRPSFADLGCGGAQQVNYVTDLLTLLGDWGLISCSPADFNFSDSVNVTDLLILLGAWGDCPP